MKIYKEYIKAPPDTELFSDINEYMKNRPNLIDAYGDGYVVLRHHPDDVFDVSKSSNSNLETSKIVINGRKRLELLGIYIFYYLYKNS